MKLEVGSNGSNKARKMPIRPSRQSAFICFDRSLVGWREFVAD